MYDFHVSGNLSDCAGFAEKLGWKGICYVIPWEDFEKEKASVKKAKKDIDIALGVLIEAKTMNQIKKLVDEFRERAELIFVRGGDVELNRYILDMSRVDVITDVASTGNLDFVMCKLAADHSIAIEFSFIDLLQSYSKTRSRLLAQFIKNAKLVKKYKTPFMITSGALSKWDMRSPHDLMVFGKTLGFQDPEMKAAMSSELLDENRKRLSGKKVMQGVERI